jgi:hypothetical protein
MPVIIVISPLAPVIAASVAIPVIASGALGFHSRRTERYR